MAVYIKAWKNGEYHSHNFAHAAFGFHEMGAEIIKYTSIDDIYDKVTRNDIVVDYIDQTHEMLRKFNVVPKCEDYPKELQPFMGRRIWTDTIDSINANPEKWGIFVKPIKDKAFTGKVINGPEDLVGCGNQSENYKVLCSDVLDMKREWRGFVKYDELIDLRPYRGDWHYNYDPDTVDQIMEAFRTIPDRPMGCSIDIAVTEKDGKPETIFLEMNDGYSMGNYGLQYLSYAKLLSARWSQLLGVEDEFDFRKYE
ncbi:MAG: ATP-grasp domain-containing protein [Saccharofermentans sp.]|nr:ATP-grasp domain-containing protein [Saccharofermentans sp.]